MEDLLPFKTIGLEESVCSARDAKKRLEHTLTNCLFPKQALGGYAAEGRLFFYRDDNALLFPGDEGAYYQVYYFLRAGTVFPSLPHDKALVINELDANGKQLPYLRQIEQLLFPAGFRLESRNLCMWISLAEHESRLRSELIENENRLSQKGLRFSPVETERQHEQVLELWTEHLKPTDIPLSHFDYRSHGGQVLCIADKAGTVCSVIWWAGSNKVSEWRHIVTDPAFLHRGLAYSLLCKWAVSALDAGYANGYSWCEEHNKASFSLQEKLGSRFLGRQSLQYLLP